MNEALKEAQLVDPEWAKKEGRRRLILGFLTAGVLIALAVGVPALVIGFHNGTEITRVKTQVEHSACQSQPAGVECQKAKRRAAKAESISTACIPFHQVGYECPKPGSKAATKAAEASTPSQVQISPDSGIRNGGDAESNPVGSSQPGPHGSGGLGKSGSSHQSSAPTASSSPGSSSTTERTTETVVEAAPPAEAPVRGAVGAVVESLKPTVEETGATVNGTVESVTGTTCELAKLLCHE